MTHRIREAMTAGNLPPIGGAGEVVEIDETFIGQKSREAEDARGYAHKHAADEGHFWCGIQCTDALC